MLSAEKKKVKVKENNILPKKEKKKIVSASLN